MKKTHKLEDFLAVEVAVKLHDCLNGNDEDSLVYEFMSESQTLVSWAVGQSDLNEVDIEDEIVKVLHESLAHVYPPEAFRDIAIFIKQRIQKFKDQLVL